jgi:hypothetical protein
MHLDSDLKGFIKGVTIGCSLLCAAQIAISAGLSASGLIKFHFDYTIITGTVGGTLVALGVFVWMMFSLQRALSAAENGGAEVRRGVQLGYGKRLLAQGVWIVAAIFLSQINTVCALIPLLFPKLAIYLLQITGKLNLTQPSAGVAPQVQPGAKGGES